MEIKSLYTLKKTQIISFVFFTKNRKNYQLYIFYVSLNKKIPLYFPNEINKLSTVN